jgi:hypothetical protein
MRIRWTTRIMTAAGVLTLIAGIAANGGPAKAASSKPASASVAADSTRYVTSGVLHGVAASSATSAWAVGYSGSELKPKTLIVHWNGQAWAKAPGFTPVTGELSGISVVSAKNAWSVGYTGSPGASPRTLLLHWDGKTWAAVTAPRPVSGTLAAVTTQISDVLLRWHARAVGDKASGKGPAAISMFWNGTAWAKASAPATGTFNAVAAVPGGTTWAVGTNMTTNTFSTLITRWTGKEWSKVASPTPSGYGSLTAVAAISTSDAWAVGATGLITSETLILHWNGKTWS